MSEVHIPAAPASKAQRALLLLLFVVFGTAGALRLNECELFNPDSPRYILYSRALVTQQAYRMIDSPDERLYTWRPPGLSLLLAPAAWIRPYDVVAAKIIVLAISLIFLGLVYFFTKAFAGTAGGLAAVALLGINSVTLILGTEVLTEVPYTACSLGILLLLVGRNRPARPALIVLAAGLFAFLPLVRTIGVALVAAAGLWAISARSRWRWLFAVGAGIAGIMVWSWRNAALGGPNYAGSLLSELSQSGALAIGLKLASTAAFYLRALLGLLLPGLAPGGQLHTAVVVQPVPSMEAWYPAGQAAAWIILLLSLYGLWQKRAAGGWLCLLYAAVYCGCLTVWPWRDERFVWPLLPLVWAFSLGVIRDLLEAFGRHAPRGLWLARWAVCGMLFVAGGWQLFLCGLIVDTNVRLLREGDGFFAKNAPSFYFSDWNAAGNWIRENTPPHARLLTWHADVALTARRYQRRDILEVISPETLHRHVRDFGARYLVVANQFGDGFNWRFLDADPIYRFKRVYDARNVVVLEIEPNRTGTVKPSGSFADEQLAACTEAIARLPDRWDLQVRRASLLKETGRRGDAIRILREQAGHGVGGVRLYSELGWMLFDAGEYAEAARHLSQAASMPYAEPIAAGLRQGAQQARARMNREGDRSFQPTSHELVLSANNALARLDYPAALKLAEKAIGLAPSTAEALFLQGGISQRLGRVEEAEAAFEQALRAGEMAAEEKLHLIRQEREFQRHGPSDSAGKTEGEDRLVAVIELAELYRRDGIPGKALTLLEENVELLGRPLEILLPLAELYLVYSRPEFSAPLYREALQRDPVNAAAASGLKAATEFLREPTY